MDSPDYEDNSPEEENEELMAIDNPKVHEDDDDDSAMYEGKNIHTSPTDGKLLCSYSQKLCKQRRLNGFAFCIRHVLEDKSCPFKQCSYMAKYNGQQCTNPIPENEDRIYCNSHLQVLGVKPKKSRKRKGDEVLSESESESLSSVEIKPQYKNVKTKLKKSDAKAEKHRKHRRHRSPQHHHRKNEKGIKHEKAIKHGKGLKAEKKKKLKGLPKSTIKESKKKLKTKSEKNVLVRRPVVQNVKKKKVKAKKRIAINVKYPSVKAMREMRRNQKKFMRNILLSVDNEYLSSSGTDEPDAGDIEYNRYWQKSCLDPYWDTDDASANDSQLDYESIRTRRKTCLRDKLRREVYQIARFTSQNTRQSKALDRYLKFLLKTTKQSPYLAARILCEKDHAKRLTKRQSVIITCCYIDDEETRCSKNALPYSKYCDLHISYDKEQVLFASCTAKFPGGISCAKTTLDFLNDKPLCEEHSKKKILNNGPRSAMNQDARGIKRKLKVKEQSKKSSKMSNKLAKKSAKLSSERESPPYMLSRLSDSGSDLISQRTPTPHSFNRLSPVLPEFLSNMNIPGEFHSLDTDMLFDIASDIASGKNGEIDDVTAEEVAAVLAEVAMEGNNNNNSGARILPPDVETPTDREDSGSEDDMTSVGTSPQIADPSPLHNTQYNITHPPRNLSPEITSSSVMKLGAIDPLMSETIQPHHGIWSNTIASARGKDVSPNFIRGSSVSPGNVVHSGLNQTFSFESSVIQQSPNLNDNDNTSVCDITPSAFAPPHQMFKSTNFTSDNYSKNTLNPKHRQHSYTSPNTKNNRS
ncbi:INO80 complex subunit D [Trichoplax sp. H2]|nr:INO80 complex subunit D [Trichoplax sp. H2]|eukprot:RDD39504.1 INO80 complex subunit D [Trichoplax sp. H2]